MIIKVCGLRDRENHQEISNLDVEMIGINLYEPSSRYIGDFRLEQIENQIRVGVFVKASIPELQEAVDNHHLDLLQLHGDESVDYCQEAQNLKPIIKVFRIDPDFDWTIISDFDFADYILLDTKTEKFGGSGKKFDWSILDQYNLDKPFLLSGGIGPEDVEQIKEIKHPQFAGVDINSKFEISPAMKDASLVSAFTKEIRKIES